MNERDILIIDGMGRFSILAQKIVNEAESLEEAREKIRELREKIIQKLGITIVEYST